jgi:hypothetical protein
MKERDETGEGTARVGATEGGVGDVETAGETTAAATVGGGSGETKPVGADTLVKVADTPHPKKNDQG